MAVLHHPGTTYWLLVAAIFLLPFGTLYQLPMAVLALVGATLWLRGRFDWQQTAALRWLTIAFALLTLPLLLALLTAYDPQRTGLTLLRLSAYWLAGLAIIHLAVHHPRQLPERPLLLAVAAIITFWAVDAYWQLFTGRNLFGQGPGPGELAQVTGIFHPNFRIGLIFAHLSLFFLEGVRHLARRHPVAWLLLLPYLSVIAANGTRTAWIVTALSLLLWSLWLALLLRSRNAPSPLARRLILATPLLLLAAAFPFIVHPAIRSRLSDLESSRIRLEIWQAVWNLLPDYWVTGIGSHGAGHLAAQAAGLTEPFFSHPHLYALDVLISTGVVGVAAYLLLWLLGIRLYLRLPTTTRRAVTPYWIATALILFPLSPHWGFYGNLSVHLASWIGCLTLALTARQLNDRGGGG